jgi:hypothetical protein
MAGWSFSIAAKTVTARRIQEPGKEQQRTIVNLAKAA